MKPATRAVLEFLRARGRDGVTPAEARTALGCDRLAARVRELRQLGFDVETVRERSDAGANFARYYIHEALRSAPMTGEQIGLSL